MEHWVLARDGPYRLPASTPSSPLAPARGAHSSPHSPPPVRPPRPQPKPHHPIPPHTPVSPSVYGRLAPPSSHRAASSYRTAPSSAAPPALARSPWSFFGSPTQASAPARYRPPTSLGSLSPLPHPLFQSRSAPNDPRASPSGRRAQSWLRRESTYEDSRAGDFPNEGEGDISQHSPTRRSLSTRPASLARPPSYPSTPSAREAYDKKKEDEALGEWAHYEPPFQSGYTGAGGDALQHLGVGFARRPGSARTPGGGSRSERIAARRERLERKFGKVGEPGDERAAVQTVEELVREADERKRRREQREVEWSGADDKGRLVGGRFRGALRWVQMLFVLGIAFGDVGANILTSPETTPPLKQKPMTYALYILPILSLALSLYLFAIRPCLYRRRSIRDALAPHQAAAGPNALSVITLDNNRQQQWGPCGVGCCGRRAGKAPPGFSKREWALRQQAMGVCQPPTVNLLVDAAPLAALLQHKQSSTHRTADKDKRRRVREKRKRRLAREARRAAAEAAGDPLRREEGAEDAWGSDTSSSSEEDSDEDEEGDLPTARERQVAMHKWAQARAWAKKLAAVDCVSGGLWIAVVAAAIYFGGTCPSAGYDGWCNYYNLGLAMAVLSAVASWASAALGLVDLRRCDVPPLGLHAADQPRGAALWA